MVIFKTLSKIMTIPWPRHIFFRRIRLCRGENHLYPTQTTSFSLKMQTMHELDRGHESNTLACAALLSPGRVARSSIPPFFL